jgi:anti-anti-sigma factor
MPGGSPEPNDTLPRWRILSSGKGAAMQVPSDAFSVRVVPCNGAAHLRLSGRFDVSAVRALDDLIGVTQRLDVVMDLRDVTFMDGAAWLAVMDFEHRAHDWGKELRLIETPSHVRRIFELTATEYLLSDTERSTNGQQAVMR